MKVAAHNYEALSLAQSPDAVILTTAEGAVRYWNRGAESIFGFAREEVLGRSLAELMVPAERLDEEWRFRAETLHAGSATFETVRRKKDGSFVYVDVSSKLVRERGEDAPLILSTNKDVTRLRIQREAKLMEARFRELLESMPDGIVMTNFTGHIVYANGQAETLFGYAPGELRGRLVELLLPARFRLGHVAHRSNYSSQPRTRGMGVGLELYGLRKDASEFPVEISLSPLHTDEGTMVMSAIRDISERKRIERALQEKNVELENASRAKDRFLASMSHELRTPLNAIIGFTGTLLMKLPGPLNAEQEKQLKTVQGSARHLLALINDLLDLAKIEAGKVELKLEPTPCQSVLEEVVASLRPQAEAKGLRFEADVPAEAIMVRTDRRALRQILFNLANNAIKFTDRGSVRLSLAERSEGDARVVEIAVEDTGVGIRDEDQAKLFSAFSQVQSANRRNQEGTGLGLHLSRKLAGLLGGQISCASEFGKGSRFTLSLTER